MDLTSNHNRTPHPPPTHSKLIDFCISNTFIDTSYLQSVHQPFKQSSSPRSYHLNGLIHTNHLYIFFDIKIKNFLVHSQCSNPVIDLILSHVILAFFWKIHKIHCQ